MEGKLRSTLGVRRRRARRLRSEGVAGRPDVLIFGDPVMLPSRMVLSVLVRLREVEVGEFDVGDEEVEVGDGGG